MPIAEFSYWLRRVLWGRIRGHHQGMRLWNCLDIKWLWWILQCSGHHEHDAKHTIYDTVTLNQCCFAHDPLGQVLTQRTQERHLERRNTLGGLQISILHQIHWSWVLPHLIEVSPPHNYPQKKLHPSNQPGEVSNNKYICSSVPLWFHLKPNCQVCQLCCFVDTVPLPCAFAPILMVQSHSQCCCQSI